MAQTERGLGSKPGPEADQGRPGRNVSAGTKGWPSKDARCRSTHRRRRRVEQWEHNVDETCRRLDIWKQMLCGYVPEKRA